MFKVGDKVVIINAHPDYNGLVVEILELSGNGIKVSLPRVGTKYGNSENFVLEEVYNSPLYQAMKEDEYV